ncbi:hypothetical protein F4U94_16350 [Sphingobium limneticum]|nr:MULTISPECIES: hypothetical protein [Sphingobium]KAA9013400.1 hypothetical protein F4U94_16350 [Sphingobium limneticum]
MSLGRRFLATGMTLLLATSITAAPARADDTFSGFGNSAFMSSMMDNVRMDSLHRHMQDPHDGDQPRAPDRKAGPIKPARPASPRPRRIPPAMSPPPPSPRGCANNFSPGSGRPPARRAKPPCGR